jgi:hypothetical protein
MGHPHIALSSSMDELGSNHAAISHEAVENALQALCSIGQKHMLGMGAWLSAQNNAFEPPS